MKLGALRPRQTHPARAGRINHFMVHFITSPGIVEWVIIPALIFIARLIDVSLATLRHILINRGERKIVPFLAFIEVSVWLLAISQVMQNLSNIACFLAWAAGFSLGTHVGMMIEGKLALGHQLVRVIMNGEATGFIQRISKQQYGITSMKASGARGDVEVLLIISERRRLKGLLELLQSIEPQPFYTIEDVRTVGTSNSIPYLPPGRLAMEGTLKKK